MDYYLEAFGHDPVHYYNLIIKIPPSRKNEPSKMMVIGKEDTRLNKIQINTIPSIIRFGENFIN